QRFRWPLALSAGFVVAVAWVAQAITCFAMIADRSAGVSASLFAEAGRGFVTRNLMIDPHWVSPVLLPLVVLGVVAGARRARIASTGAALLAVLVVAAPFFAVVTCSSDAVRYQSALLGLLISLAVAGVWAIPAATLVGRFSGAVVRGALLATLVALPPPSRQPPADPVAVEHRLVVEALGRLQPDTLVVLPQGRFEHVIPDFPDFLLPKGSKMV